MADSIQQVLRNTYKQTKGHNTAGKSPDQKARIRNVDRNVGIAFKRAMGKPEVGKGG
jgi:hypothetical protein